MPLLVDPAILGQQFHSNDRNLSVSYLRRALGMPEGDIEENTAVHLAACSVTVTTDELALMGATLANGRINPLARTVARREPLSGDDATARGSPSGCRAPDHERLGATDDREAEPDIHR